MRKSKLIGMLLFVGVIVNCLIQLPVYAAASSEDPAAADIIPAPPAPPDAPSPDSELTSEPTTDKPVISLEEQIRLNKLNKANGTTSHRTPTPVAAAAAAATAAPSGPGGGGRPKPPTAGGAQVGGDMAAQAAKMAARMAASRTAGASAPAKTVPGTALEVKAPGGGGASSALATPVGAPPLRYQNAEKYFEKESKNLEPDRFGKASIAATMASIKFDLILFKNDVEASLKIAPSRLFADQMGHLAEIADYLVKNPGQGNPRNRKAIIRGMISIATGHAASLYNEGPFDVRRPDHRFFIKMLIFMFTRFKVVIGEEALVKEGADKTQIDEIKKIQAACVGPADDPIRGKYDMDAITKELNAVTGASPESKIDVGTLPGAAEKVVELLLHHLHQQAI